MHRCGLLLSSSIVATDVAQSVLCRPMYVCVLGKRVSSAKTAEPIEIPFGGGGREITHMDAKNHVLDRGQD